jgi:protein SCO1/2
VAAVSPQRKRLLLAATVGVLAVWAGLLVVVAAQREPAAPAVPVAGTPTDGPLLGGTLPEGLDGRQAADFALRDAREDERIDTRGLRGQPYVVTFLYTECVDVCPLIATELDEALEGLGRDVPIIAVSADPEGDTEIAVRRWFAQRDLPDSFRYVIGTEEDLRPVWDAYYAAPQPQDRDVSAHSASIWLVDAQGRLRSKFSGGIPVPPADIAHDLRVLLEEAA